MPSRGSRRFQLGRLGRLGRLRRLYVAAVAVASCAAAVDGAKADVTCWEGQEQDRRCRAFRLYQESRGKLRSRSWEAALRLARKAASIAPDDHPSLSFDKVCIKFEQRNSSRRRPLKSRCRDAGDYRPHEVIAAALVHRPPMPAVSIVFDAPRRGWRVGKLWSSALVGERLGFTISVHNAGEEPLSQFEIHLSGATRESREFPTVLVDEDGASSPAHGAITFGRGLRIQFDERYGFIPPSIEKSM